MIGSNPRNLIVGWSKRFFFFVVLCQFSQDVRENQILIPDWTYFRCPGATLVLFLANEKSIFEFFTQPKFSLSSEPPEGAASGKFAIISFLRRCLSL